MKVKFILCFLFISTQLLSQNISSPVVFSPEEDKYGIYIWKSSDDRRSPDYKEESLKFYNDKKVLLSFDGDAVGRGVYKVKNNSISVKIDDGVIKRTYKGKMVADQLQLKIVKGDKLDKNENRIYSYFNISPKVELAEAEEIPGEEELYEEVDVNLDAEINEEQDVDEYIFEEDTSEEIFQVVDEPAIPKVGYEKFYEQINKNMKNPSRRTEGTVYVQFIVDFTGELKDFEVVRNLSQKNDEEAIRLIKLTSPWFPPKQKGKEVRQRIIIPVKFQNK